MLQQWLYARLVHSSSTPVAYLQRSHRGEHRALLSSGSVETAWNLPEIDELVGYFFFGLRRSLYQQDLLAPLLIMMFPPAFTETSAVSPSEPRLYLWAPLTPCLSQRLTQSAEGNASLGTWKGSVVYRTLHGTGKREAAEPKVQKRPRFTRTFQECSRSHQATFPSILLVFV